MLVDSHCHLPLVDKTAGGADRVIAKAREHGVEHFLCIGVDLETLPGVMALTERYYGVGVSATVGVHPNHHDGEEPTEKRLVALAETAEVVGIGETGLDYFRSKPDQVEAQHRRFRAHIHAARTLGKPLVIHTRESAEDALKVLQEEGAREVGGVLHCFVEDWEIASRAMDLNFYISFSGIVTFPTAEKIQDVARRMPLERMLVETDAPWLAPVPLRGKTNEPANVRLVAEFIARQREIGLEEIARATTRNFFTLFSGARPVPAMADFLAA